MRPKLTFYNYIGGAPAFASPNFALRQLVARACVRRGRAFDASPDWPGTEAAAAAAHSSDGY